MNSSSYLLMSLAYNVVYNWYLNVFKFRADPISLNGKPPINWAISESGL